MCRVLPGDRHYSRSLKSGRGKKHTSDPPLEEPRYCFNVLLYYRKAARVSLKGGRRGRRGEKGKSERGGMERKMERERERGMEGKVKGREGEKK